MQKNQRVNRRNFIKSSTLFAVAISALGIDSCVNDKTDTTKSLPTNCKTTADILGPFYKEGAPFRENVIPQGILTSPLVIEGNVFSDCKNLINNATVEIWNADAEGAYDNSDRYFYRGRYLTQGDGLFRFETIIPGKYLNGANCRPSHIHFLITAPGHVKLISQIYFTNDPYISSDPWASNALAKERILTVNKNAEGKDSIRFDIHLLKV